MSQRLLQDFRSGWRQLGKDVGVTTVIVLSFALGIGANTAIFTLVNAVMTTQSAQIERAVGQERVFAFLSSFFGLIALLLACIGLHGTMAYAVTQRRSEIGVRMALGADRGRIVTLVLREVLLLVALGVAIGVAGGLMTTTLVGSMLFGLEPTDPATLAMATGLLLCVALLAGALPAYRASRVNPIAVLRYQ